jgi:hypothetical protein
MNILLINTWYIQYFSFVTALAPQIIQIPDKEYSRRKFFHDSAFRLLVGVSSGITSLPSNAVAQENELPLSLRDFTKLAPLGSSQTLSAENKTRNLSLPEIAKRLENDLSNGSTGQRGYIISGDISTDLFRDDCTFVDPTNRVKSLNQYQNALRILFDPKRSTVSIIDPLTVDEETRTIRGRYRSRGYLQLPWNPYVSSYEASITYKIDPDGLVEEQSQTWSKSATRALQETFTPSIFPRTPTSTLEKPANEPQLVTKLFETVNGRRLDDFSAEERLEIDALIHQIAQEAHPAGSEKLLVGTWRLSYLQPGPGGAGIDRRIPFPDFSFNQNFQLFTSDHRIINRGELLGPWLDVRVLGNWEATTGGSSLQRFKADIQSGQMCRGPTFCAPLPITGEGLFESVYLGDRLRIGRNINGGSAVVVQVRLT